MQKNSHIVIVEDDKDLCAGLCKELISKSKIDVYKIGILPDNLKEMYDRINYL